MDRRQRKTREAIFSAFTALLSQKSYHRISVQEIIDEADVGRTTFYSHFETKDFLLKALCEELFEHIIGHTDNRYNHCTFNGSDSVFLHLLHHIKKNEFHIADLLSSQNNEIFLRYFKDNLKHLILTQYDSKGVFSNNKLPKDYLINHISSSFVETVVWWISNKMKEPPEAIAGYFLSVIEPVL